MNFSDSVLLIGNGPSVLDYKFGEIIDSFGKVARCNNFQIQKYEKHVGTKTNLFFRRPCNNVTDHGISFEKIILCVTSRPNAGGALLRSANSMRNRLKKKHIVEVYGGHIIDTLSKEANLDFNKNESASVGLIAIYYLINEMCVNPLYIHGFDHLKKNGEAGIHYFPKPGSGVEFHNGVKERKYVDGLIKEGKIIRLSECIS